jgi:hypothetical protein
MSQKGRLAERVLAASKAARIAKASRLGIIASALLTFMIFSVSYYGQKVGNFTFTLDELAMESRMSLYENSEDKEYKTRIIADQVAEADGMTSYCGVRDTDGNLLTPYPVGESVCMPSDDWLTSVDGPNNGENYLAYTFYLEHAGTKPVDLQASITMISASKGAEDAVRVRVIFDGEGTTYAKLQSSNSKSPGEPEPYTSPFLGITSVMEKKFTRFEPGSIVKVTVILWYEGEDSNHNIDLHSGGVKFEMKFTVTKIYQNNEL